MVSTSCKRQVSVSTDDAFKLWEQKCSYPCNFFSVRKTVIVTHASILTRKIPTRNVQFIFTTWSTQKARQVFHSPYRTHFNTPNNLTIYPETKKINKLKLSNYMNQTHSIGIPGNKSLIAVTMAVMRESDVWFNSSCVWNEYTLSFVESVSWNRITDMKCLLQKCMGTTETYLWQLLAFNGLQVKVVDIKINFGWNFWNKNKQPARGENLKQNRTRLSSLRHICQQQTGVY